MSDPTKAMGEAETFLTAFLRAAGIEGTVTTSAAGGNAVFSIMPKTEKDASRAIGSGGSTASALRKLVRYIGHLHGFVYELDVNGRKPPDADAR